MQKILFLIKSNQEMLVNFSVAVICLLLFSFFPANSFSQNLTKSLFFLVFIPFLYIKYILKKNFSDFGFSLKINKDDLIWGGLMLAISLLIIYLLANFTAFGKNYHLSHNVSKSFWLFAFYELVLVNVLFFIQEYFFKGFIISIFRGKIGYLSILIQAIIYLIPLWIFSSSIWQAIPLSIFALAGGLAAFKGRSFIYSYIPGIFFLIITDAYIIYLNK
jgi:hypothetical protein